MAIHIHPTADIAEDARIGESSAIWHHSQVRPGVTIGQGCIIGKGVYIDQDVTLGNYVKVQNYVSIFHGVEIEDGVLVGPHVCFTNDLRPRAINPDGTLKGATDWIVSATRIKYGASLGANSTILCGIVVGKWAMVGAGSVVTHHVPPHGLVLGNPARLQGFVCACGQRAETAHIDHDTVELVCTADQTTFTISRTDYDQLAGSE
jgi:acetyltransferase-like isoleucine patch superfamily enzyme